MIRTPIRRYVKRTSIPIGAPATNDVSGIADSEAGIYKRDIKMFTVEAGMFADRLRSHQHQLQCIGGDALKNTKLHPQSMVFVNIGVDDKGIVNWSYMAPQLNNQVTMNNVIVTFEAVNSSGRVRPGSAVVRYHLELKNDTDDNIIHMLVLIIVVTLCVLGMIIESEPHAQRANPLSPTIIINTTTTDNLDKTPKQHRHEHARKTQTRNDNNTYSPTESRSSPVIGVSKTGDEE